MLLFDFILAKKLHKSSLDEQTLFCVHVIVSNKRFFTVRSPWTLFELSNLYPNLVLSSLLHLDSH